MLVSGLLVLSLTAIVAESELHVASPPSATC